MLKKSLFFGIAAVLSAALMFTACPSDVEYRDRDVEKIVEKEKEKEVLQIADTAVTNETGLTAALDNPDYKVIALAGDVSLSSGLDIPAEKTLILYSELDTNSNALTIAGIVKVGSGGTLTASASGIATVTGGVEVYGGGTVSLDAAESLVGLDSGKISFKGGTLAAGWPTDLASVTAAFGYVAAGVLDLSDAALTTLKLSELAAIPGISASRGLTAAATEDEDALSLNIPAGAVLTANGSDDLDTVASLSVYGSLDAGDAAGPSEGIAITVGPGAVLEVGDIALLKASSAAAGATLTTGDVTAFDGDAVLTAYAGATVNGIVFPRQASINGLAAATVTITGSLSLQTADTLDLGADLALDDGAVLVLPDPAKVTGAKKIIADAGSITIAGVPGYTTTAAGIAGSGFETAHSNLTTDMAKLVNNPELTLDSETFGVSSSVIGSATLANTSAIDVSPTADGTNNGSITFDDDTTLAAGSATHPSSVAGTNASVITADNVSISIGSAKLQIADSDADGNNLNHAAVSFTSVQIANGGLVSPALSFNIGIVTKRS